MPRYELQMRDHGMAIVDTDHDLPLSLNAVTRLLNEQAAQLEQKTMALRFKSAIVAYVRRHDAALHAVACQDAYARTTAGKEDHL